MKINFLEDLSVELRNAILKVLQKKSNIKKMEKYEVTNFDIMGVLAGSTIDILSATTELSNEEWTKILAETFKNAINEEQINIDGDCVQSNDN